ncbi:hypothetical protein SCA6_017553 [Theobroma cacao]
MTWDQSSNNLMWDWEASFSSSHRKSNSNSNQTTFSRGFWLIDSWLLRMENQAKKVLLTSNGDEISMNIALHLAKRGCRLKPPTFFEILSIACVKE